MRKWIIRILGLLLILALIFYIVRVMMFRSNSEELRWDWSSINTNDLYFPKNFVWGVASAAHQVEGNCTNNNWYAWESAVDADGNPRIHNNEKAGLACSHWSRYPEDIQLMKELGVDSYRFSVEWSKIEPSEGQFDDAALQHYVDVCKALLVEGITPVVTLHHFTNPIWFEDKGGWEKEENIELFVRFSQKVFVALQPYVKMWCTINEPNVYITASYVQGIFPPGGTDKQVAATVLKHLLMAHVETFRTLKSLPGGQEAQVGIVKDIFQFDPWNRWNLFDWYLTDLTGKAFNESTLQFFETGDYHLSFPPEANLSYTDKNAPKTLDFIGLNYYSHMVLSFGLDLDKALQTKIREGEVKTDMDYPLYPEGFYRALKRIGEVGVPVYVTENGIADAQDDRRETFIRRYIYAMSKAIRDGVDIRGYYYWSLMDNFEWAEGYTMKFGLYEVDFGTQKRTLRKGSKAFQEIVGKH